MLMISIIFTLQRIAEVFLGEQPTIMSLFSGHKNYCNCLANLKHNDDDILQENYSVESFLGHETMSKFSKALKLT